MHGSDPAVDHRTGVGPRSNGMRMIPAIASDGIHDRDVTDDS